MPSKLTKSEKEWIDGYFIGNESGKKEMVKKIIKYLKRINKKLVT